MPDENLRRSQRAAHAEAGSEAAALLARLRAGEVTRSQAELAAYLGGEVAQQALGLGGGPEEDREEFLWGLCDWGLQVQRRACLVALQQTGADQPLSESLRAALDVAERCVEGEATLPDLERAVEAVEGDEDGVLGTGVFSPELRNALSADPVDEEEIRRLLDAHFEQTSHRLEQTSHAKVLEGLQRFVGLLRVNEPNPLRQAQRAIRFLESMELDLWKPQLLQEAFLHEVEPRGDVRASARLTRYEESRKTAPSGVRQLREWEYYSVRPLGDDEAALKATGQEPKDCLAVGVHWRHQNDATYLMIMVYPAMARSGFEYVYEPNYSRLTVETFVPAEFIDQGWAEAAMLAWGSLRDTLQPSLTKQRIGDRGLEIYLDDERTPPPGWILVRWPEEAIALLMTCQVTALSLDHDLGDLDDERTGYVVLQWLEEQVATCGFVPPEEIAVHSANASAAIKMRSAIESIRRLHDDNLGA